MHGYGGSWRVLYRMHEDVNNDHGNWRRRTFLMKHYGYRNYNYMYFSYSDQTSAGHYFQTPHYYFTYYKWYFFISTANYDTGKYSIYLYDPTAKTQLKWSYTRSVKAKYSWETAYGMRKEYAFVWIGGDRWYE